VPKCFATKKNMGGMRKKRTLFETAGNETAVFRVSETRIGKERRIPKRDTQNINIVTATLVDDLVAPVWWAGDMSSDSWPRTKGMTG
jgi:hypothetical protein